jgi:hypothetical protein
MNAVLWVLQALLALLFLWAGGFKLVVPLEQLVGPVPLPGPFLRFIAVAEIAGALGLVLPGVVGIRPGLTPLAAAGLTLIMVGATAVTVAGGTLPMALIPAGVGVLAGFVAYGRWRLAPLGPRRPGRPLPPAGGKDGSRRGRAGSGRGSGPLAVLSVVAAIGAPLRRPRCGWTSGRPTSPCRMPAGDRYRWPITAAGRRSWWSSTAGPGDGSAWRSSRGRARRYTCERATAEQSAHMPWVTSLMPRLAR